MKRKTNKDIAKTDKDWSMGILNGKTVFPFGYPGNKQMTMNTPGGVVPYPIEYIGTTGGYVTDRGIANPGDNFVVNGDTIIENKLNMKEYYNPGKQFKQRASELNNNYQEGGRMTPLQELKKIKNLLMKKYQNGSNIDPEEAANIDRSLQQYAVQEKQIPRSLLDKTATRSDIPQGMGNRPTLGNYQGYDIKQDDKTIEKWNGQVDQLPGKTINNAMGNESKPYLNSKHSQNYTTEIEARQAAGKTASGAPKDFVLYANAAIPGFFKGSKTLEGQDMGIGVFGQEATNRLLKAGVPEELLRTITLKEAASPDGRLADVIGEELERETAYMTGVDNQAYGQSSKSRGTNMNADQARQTIQSSANPLKTSMRDVALSGTRFSPNSLPKVNGLKINYGDLSDQLNTAKDTAMEYLSDNGLDPNDPAAFEQALQETGAYNNPIIRDYYAAVGGKRESTATDLTNVESREVVNQNQPDGSGYNEGTDGAKLAYQQALAKQKASTYNQSGRGYGQPQDQGGMFGRQQTGQAYIPATNRRVNETQAVPKQVTRKEYYTTPIKQLGGVLNKYQKGDMIDIPRPMARQKRKPSDEYYQYEGRTVPGNTKSFYNEPIPELLNEISDNPNLRADMRNYYEAKRVEDPLNEGTQNLLKYMQEDAYNQRVDKRNQYQHGGVLDNNNSYYRSQPGISDFMGTSMFFGQDGGYTENVYPTLDPRAQSIVKYGRDYNYNYGLKELGGRGNDKYSYQKGGMLPRAQVGLDFRNAVRKPVSQTDSNMINLNNRETSYKHYTNPDYNFESRYNSPTERDSALYKMEYDKFSNKELTPELQERLGLFNRQVAYNPENSDYYKAQNNAQKEAIHDNDMLNFITKNRKLVGHNVDRMHKQTGGPVKPKYRVGQTIQYKQGGTIKTGVVAGYSNGKIKLK
jgi:hypothetical protein